MQTTDRRRDGVPFGEGPGPAPGYGSPDAEAADAADWLAEAEPLDQQSMESLVRTAEELTRSRNLAALARIDTAFAMIGREQALQDLEAQDDAEHGRSPEPDYARIDAERRVRTQVTAAMRLTAWHAGRLVTTAVQLHTRLRRLDSAARLGTLDETTLITLACRLKDVPDEMLARVESNVVREVMDRIDGGDQPTRDGLNECVDRAVETLDREDLDRRAEKAREGRRVSFRPQGDGMTSMWATMSSEDAAELKARLEAIADTQDPLDRTRAQHLADVLARLGLARRDPADSPTAAPADAGTGALPDGGCDGACRAPVPTTTLRISVISSIAAGLPARVEFVRGAYASYEWLLWKILSEGNEGVTFDVIDPTPGAEDDPRTAMRYALSAAMKRRIRARDGTCRHPGCTVDAEECEIDHVIAFDRLQPELGGPSMEWNLVCLCKRHHIEKTHGRWAYSPGPLGELIIVTDTGHTYRTRPSGMLARAREDRLAYADDPERYATSFRDELAAARAAARSRGRPPAGAHEASAEAPIDITPVDLPAVDLPPDDDWPAPMGPLHLIDEDGGLTNPPGAERRR